jgi:hypothetical protein
MHTLSGFSAVAEGYARIYAEKGIAHHIPGRL